MSVKEPVETRTEHTIQKELESNPAMMSKVIAYTKVREGDWVAVGDTDSWSAVISIKTEGWKKTSVIGISLIIT